MVKTYAEINAKIAAGEAVIVTADEVVEIVNDIGLKKATELVDVVTTATFGPMCSSGAFINFGHSNPPIRMTKTFLNNVEGYSGIAAVDTYIGATQVSEINNSYGGAHVICDLIDGKEISLKASSPGTDCYPTKKIEASVKLSDLNEAYLFNPRNAYQNYNAAINTSNKPLYTYMGKLSANMGNINYSTSGQLSPLLNDPYYHTIGVGTRIFLAGAEGYIAWCGTQFNSAANRAENGVPTSPAGTLATIGNLNQMSTRYIRPAYFKNYGVSLFVGIGIPIPVLNEEIMGYLALGDESIYTSIVDYSDHNHPIIKKVSYKELKSGSVNIANREVKTHCLTDLKKSKEIAELLKQQIINKDFFLQEPVKMFSQGKQVKSMANYQIG